MSIFKIGIIFINPVFFFIFTIPILFFTAGIRAEASSGDFYHEHNTNCYQKVYKTCNNDTLRNTYSTDSYHCPRCGTITSFHQSIWWAVCLNGYKEPRDIAYYESCNTCGYVRTDDKVDTDLTHTYKVMEAVCGKEAKSLAHVTFEPDNTVPTNNSVILRAKVEINDSEFGLAQTPFNFGSGYGNLDSIEVSENGVYSVRVLDNRGKEIALTQTVNNIDRAVPTINSITKSTEDWTEEGLYILVEACDEGPADSLLSFSFNGSEYGDSNSFFVSSNGTVAVSVKDSAGNISEGSIVVGNIGRDPVIVAREEAELRERLAREERERAQAQALQKEKEAALEKERLEKEKQEKERLEQLKKEQELADKEKLKENKLSAKDGLKNESKTKKESIDKLLSEYKKSFVSSTMKKDVSDNSGLIAVTYVDRGESGESSFDEDNINEEIDTEVSLKEEPTLVTASVGRDLLKIGPFVLALGLIFFSFFNYIYVTENGRPKIKAMFKVRLEKERTVICIPSGKLVKNERYRIYFSLWNRIRRNKKLPVYVEIGRSEELFKADEGIAFKY